MYIPQMEPWFGQEETNEITAYLAEGGWMTEFQRTIKFEDQIAKYTGAKHCIVVNNGTISLTLAAIVCGIGYGDEVIIPNYTMIASPNSVKMIGAVPVFVDVEPETLCLDISLVEKAITKKTKAIMLVTANGRYPKAGIESIVDLCAKYGLKLIEDAAQSLGSFYPNGTHMGLMGDVGSFSFSAPKVISTGQGGALVTNNDEISNKIRKLKDFGRSGGGNDIHDTIGYNFKFTELQACLGIQQMEKLQWRVNRKKEIFYLYKSKLENTPQIQFFDQNLENTTPWFIDAKVEKRSELIDFLKSENIGTRIMYPPINRQIAYNVDGRFPVSEEIGNSGLWLPSASQLEDESILRICLAINNFYNK